MHNDQKKKLKKQAHHLKPIILLGDKGLTPAVLKEIEVALDHHELIKIKIPSSEQKEFQQTAAQICEATQAEKIQTIGHVLTIYRKADK